MSQMAVGIKADLSGTRAYGKCALMHGCAKMFRDASFAFSTCGSTGVGYSQRCAVESSEAYEE